MWNQAQAALQKISPMQMMKQPGQNPPPAFYMAAQEPLKMYEQQLQPPGQPPLAAIDKKMKFPNVKMQQDFYWEPSYRMGDRMKRLCPEDPPAGPRGLPFEVRSGEGGGGGEREGGGGGGEGGGCRGGLPVSLGSYMRKQKNSNILCPDRLRGSGSGQISGLGSDPGIGPGPASVQGPGFGPGPGPGSGSAPGVSC